MDDNKDMKQVPEYETPKVVDYGDIFEITAATRTTPTRLDASYPAGASGTIFS
jgi:hypothetical protein